MDADLGNLFSVALLALLGTWIVGRFALGRRFMAMTPMILSIGITWAFGSQGEVLDVLIHGVASGLLAAGSFHVFLGVLDRP
jgi:hypothetical protein